MAARTDELMTEIRATRARLDRTLDDIGARVIGRLTERLEAAASGIEDTVAGHARPAADVRGDVEERARPQTGA